MTSLFRRERILKWRPVNPDDDDFQSFTEALATTDRFSETRRHGVAMETSETNTAIQFRLLIVGDGTVRTVPLHGTRWVIGRATDCTIPLRDPTVSRRHLLIERQGEGFRFQDLGGSNPVLLDGRASNTGTIRLGQTLAIGMTRLTIEQRHQPSPLTTRAGSTVVLSREVIDEELQAPAADSLSGTAARILDRIEWTFADLGDLSDAAEPMLTLAMNLCGRNTGWIGRFTTMGIDTLASVSTVSQQPFPLSESVLVEARRIGRPHLLTTQEGDVARNRLVIPLGNGPEGLLVLEAPEPNAPQGQELLRLAHSLSTVVWHRLQETTERLRLRDELQRLRFHGSATHNALLASGRLNDARQTLRHLAGSPTPILLVGEEGTEREALARYMHAEGPRRQSLFLPWDAARVPAWRHEKDLLGDRRNEQGLLQRCAGGTLFLDNADALAPALIAQLATRLDSESPAVEMPVLVMAIAPAAKLEWPEQTASAMASTRIDVPPLRSEPRDVLALAELFLSEMGSCPDGSPRLLTERTKRVLAAYQWPGNVRELRLVLESAAAKAGNQPMAPRHLPPPLDSDQPAGIPEIPTLEEVERVHIQSVMVRTSGNRTRAAQVLGIANSTLYEKLKRYGITD